MFTTTTRVMDTQSGVKISWAYLHADADTEEGLPRVDVITQWLNESLSLEGRHCTGGVTESVSAMSDFYVTYASSTIKCAGLTHCPMGIRESVKLFQEGRRTCQMHPPPETAAGAHP